MVSYQIIFFSQVVRFNCLNPFCNGQWSRTGGDIQDKWYLDVLILFVMDNGLVLAIHKVEDDAFAES